MNIRNCPSRCAVQLWLTCVALALSGCVFPFPGTKPSPDMVRADAVLRASLERQASSEVPASGDILIVGGGYLPGKHSLETTVATEFYSVKSNRFVLTGALHTSRIGITPVVVATGPLANHILVAGGLSGKAEEIPGSQVRVDTASALHTIESYNPATAQFTPYAHPLRLPQAYYTATPLPDGTILIAGGFSNGDKPLALAELFDPTTGTFTAFFMNDHLAFHTATLLPDGTVLLAGGVGDPVGDTTGAAEIYDPRLRTFTPTKGSFPGGITLAGQTATLIAGCHCANDGKVLLAGGFTGAGLDGWSVETATNTLLLYDPKTQTFAKLVHEMTDSRIGHSATLLPNGNILLAGGETGQFELGTKIFGISGTFLDSAELFDPATGQVSCIGGTVLRHEKKACASSMVNARALHIAALIGSGSMAGQVLLAGGTGDVAQATNEASGLRTAELFDPATGKFRVTAKLNTVHVDAGTAIVP